MLKGDKQAASRRGLRQGARLRERRAAGCRQGGDGVAVLQHRQLLAWMPALNLYSNHTTIHTRPGDD